MSPEINDFMHDSVQLLKKRQFKSPSARDRLCLGGRGRVVLAVVRLRSQMRLVGSESRSFSEQSSRFVHLSLNWGDLQEKLWRSFLRKKRTFYSLFDKEIPDVLKSVLKKKKNGVHVFTFPRNRCSNKFGIGVQINRNTQCPNYIFNYPLGVVQ